MTEIHAAVQPPRASRFRPPFEQAFRWYQHVFRLARLVEDENAKSEEHICPVGWTVKPLLVELPFGYFIRVCHGCGASYLAPEECE